MIDEKHAFLRCVDPDEKKAREEKIQLEKLKKKNNLVASIDMSNLSRTRSNENISNFRDSITTRPSLKAIKEFSYFDWSKVKQFKRSSEDIHEDKNLFRSLDDSTSIYSHLNVQSYHKEKKIKDLPQVITIRFI